MSCDIKDPKIIINDTYGAPPDMSDYKLSTNYARNTKPYRIIGSSRLVVNDMNSLVTYGETRYTCMNMTLSPRIHTWSDDPSVTTAGTSIFMELVIEHWDVNDNRLYICIPVTINENTTNGPLDRIIISTLSNIPSPSTFADIIPGNSNPFVTYDYPDGNNCVYNVRVIVFGYDSRLSINTNTIKDVIAESTQLGRELFGYGNDYGYSFLEKKLKNINTLSGVVITYRVTTDRTSSSESEIYIECQPTGSSEETTQVEMTKPSRRKSGTMKTLVIGLIITAICVFLLGIGFTYLYRKVKQSLDPTKIAPAPPGGG